MAERLARITERRDNTDGEWVRREVVERKLAFALSSENHAVSRPRRVCAGTKSISIFDIFTSMGGVVIHYPADWELDLTRPPNQQDDLRYYKPTDSAEDWAKLRLSVACRPDPLVSSWRDFAGGVMMGLLAVTIIAILAFAAP